MKDFNKRFERNKKNIVKLGIASMIVQAIFLIVLVLTAIWAWKHF